jgi:CHAD domain-containing protein
MAPLDIWLTGLPEDATVSDAARLSISARTAEVVVLLPLAAHQAYRDIEHVHQLRVATRRSSAVLLAYKKVFPVRHADRVAVLLRAVRNAAGPARDLDVFLQRLHKEGAPAGLVGRLEAQRDEAQDQILRAEARLRGGEKLVRRLAKLSRKTPDSAKRAKRIGRQLLLDWAPQQLARAVAQFAQNLPDGLATAEQLHQFRIEGKRLRYSLESLAAGLPNGVREQGYPLLKALQKRLGQMNDHESAAQRLTDWLEGAAPAEREFLEMLIAREREEQARQTLAFHEWWGAARKKKLFEALKV